MREQYVKSLSVKLAVRYALYSAPKKIKLFKIYQNLIKLTRTKTVRTIQSALSIEEFFTGVEALVNHILNIKGIQQMLLRFLNSSFLEPQEAPYLIRRLRVSSVACLRIHPDRDVGYQD